MQWFRREATGSHSRAIVDLILPIILVRASICEAIFARADKIWMQGCQRSNITCQDTSLKPVHDRFQERHTSDDDAKMDVYGGEEGTTEIIECPIARKKETIQKEKAEEYDRNNPAHLSVRLSWSELSCTYKARDENARIAGIFSRRRKCTS